MTNPRATQPETPDARRAARDAGRYSITMPPTRADAADVERFEREVREHGEQQARLRNLRRTRP